MDAAPPAKAPLFSARVRRLLPWAAAGATGLLHAGSFHPLAVPEMAWLFLVPLLMAVASATPRRAFQLGMVAGAVAWLASILWLTRVTYAGWLILALYCGLYTALFAMVSSLWLRRHGAERFLPNLGFMVFAAAAWAGLEWVRSTFGTGFPWNPLGASQFRNVVMIQSASVGGVYAVSALVVWVNVGLALTGLRYVARRGHWGRRPHPEVIAAFMVVALLFAWGTQRVRTLPRGEVPLRLALVQPGIPQEQKWDEATVELIYQRLRDLTQGALRSGSLDLIIWPETALPDDVANSEPSYALVHALATNGVPLLVGSMDTRWETDGPPRYYNSSYLFDAQGAPVAVYDKQHLVVFGEYVPGGQLVPFIKAFTPIQESFSPGAGPVLMRLREEGPAFAPLICFEDTVPPLARAAVKAGARLLVNQTNDAWFDPMAASRQHMAAAIFRAVENAVPLVRVANSGVSCVIDARGSLRAQLADADGAVRIAGFKRVDVRPSSADMALTFYTRHGDLFATVAGLLALLVAWRLARSAAPGVSGHSSGMENRSP